MQQQYDVAIVGGGLAGLSLSVLLAKAGKKILLIEKKKYPMHKVCGEYVSLESWDFLTRLGLPLHEWQLPIIKNLNITMPAKTSIAASLPLGAMGISRYKLDFELYELAKKSGVTILEHCNFKNVQGNFGSYNLDTSVGVFNSKIFVAATGKWHLQNVNPIKNIGEKYVGIKYHLKIDMPKDLIALHHFEGGYAGISAIENNIFCLCYMVKATVLKSYCTIKNLEQMQLSKNLFLKNIFENATFLWQEPLTISNIYFGKKQLFQNDIFFIGDAAGAIPPLAGNGMSMALRTSNILAPILVDILNYKTSINIAKTQYQKLWNVNFSKRINAGIRLQAILANAIVGPLALKIFSKFKPLQNLLIKSTHGKPF
jgi:menaquinone-9 beta-reductase